MQYCALSRTLIHLDVNLAPILAKFYLGFVLAFSLFYFRISDSNFIDDKKNETFNKVGVEY